MEKTMKWQLIKRNEPVTNPKDTNDWWDQNLAEFFEDFFDYRPGLFDKNWNPNVEINENETGYNLDVDLAGLTDKDVDVQVEDNTLYIRGERKQENERKDKKGRVYLSERRYGKFERSFRLPENIVQNKIEAKIKKGLLQVKLPKNPEAVPAKIEVKVD